MMMPPTCGLTSEVSKGVARLGLEGDDADVRRALVAAEAAGSAGTTRAAVLAAAADQRRSARRDSQNPDPPAKSHEHPVSSLRPFGAVGRESKRWRAKSSQEALSDKTLTHRSFR
jgi:hypothetical protein